MLDGRGRKVVLEAPPQRIVSGSLASDEILLALFASSGQSGRLAAVSSLADDPRYSNVVAAAKTVKGRFGEGLETALALKPDLAVLASFNKPETIDRLEKAQVRCFVLGGFTTLDEIAANVTALGELTQLKKDAGALNAVFAKARMAAWAGAVRLPRRPKVLGYLGDAAGNGALTLAARGSLFDALIEEAGGENLASSLGLTGWPTVSAEVLAGLAPDVVVTGGDGTPEALRQTLQNAPGWKAMKSLARAKMIVVPDRELGATSPYVASALTKISQGLAQEIAPGLSP